MAYILAVLILLLKIAGIILAAGAGLLLLTVLLPVRARVSGSASSAGLMEAVFEDDATVGLRVAAQDSDPDGLEDGVVPVDVDFAVQAAVLGGAVGVEMVGGGKPDIRILGMRFRPGARRQASEVPKASEVPQAREVKPKGRKRVPGKATSRKKGVSLREFRKYLAPEVRKKTWSTLRSLFRALHLEGRLDAECGFPDPGNTAMVLAGYWALGGPATFRGITFRPNFRGEAFDVRGSGELHLVPVEIGWIAVRYLLSREIRPLWWKKRKGRRSGAEADRSVGAVSAD